VTVTGFVIPKNKFDKNCRETYLLDDFKAPFITDAELEPLKFHFQREYL
jgi:hypothetical protein